jgi:nitroreductase
MEFFDIVNNRCSVRAFTTESVEDEKLLKILEASNRAPSAGNLQAYEIFVVTDPSKRDLLVKAALNQEFIASAPVVLVFCSHPARSEWRYGERGVRMYALQDATIACTLAMLAATAQGLASVWVGAFEDDYVGRVIGALDGVVPVAILPIGYADEAPIKRSRRDISELVQWT